jgi:glycosyltransferase involved in cell wall biosynthesis
MKFEFIGDSKKSKIYFLTIAEEGYSRSWNYFVGLRNIGINVEFVRLNRTRLIRSLLEIRKKKTKFDVYVIMSPSHFLVPVVRVLLGKRTYLDAGWSLFEGSVISRHKFGFFGTNVIKSYLIDFFSSLFAQKIVLESQSQRKFYSRLFLVNRNKCSVVYTGIDEEQFQAKSHAQLPADYFNNSRIVLFRGKYNKEAGIEVLAEATHLLAGEEITFWIVSPKIPNGIQFSCNTIVLDQFLNTKQELASIYLGSNLTLGQLSAHSRLSRTIPHKAFESAFFSKPYLSARTKGITELFLEGEEILCFKPNDAQDLANKIKDYFDKSYTYMKVGANMRRKYDSDLSQSKLAGLFLTIIDPSK